MRIPYVIRKSIDVSKKLYRPYFGRFAGLSVLGFFTGFLDSIGITLLIPLFAFFVGSADAVQSTFATRFLHNALARLDLTLTFKLLLVFTLTVFFSKTAFLSLFGYFRIKSIADFRGQIQRRLFQETLGADYRYLVRQKLGYLEGTLTQDVKQSARLLDYVIGVVFSLTSLASYLIVAFTLSRSITAITLLVGVGVLALYRPLIRLIRRYSVELIGLRNDLLHFFTEHLSGIKTVKAMHVERQIGERIGELFKGAEVLEVKRQLVKYFAKISIEPITIVFVLTVFAVSYFFFKFNIVQFVAIVYMIQQIFINVEKLQSSIHVMQSEIPHALAVVKLLDEVGVHRGEEVGGGPFAFADRLAFRGVNFDYIPGRTTLRDVSFSIKKGELLGIIGPSGAGKTTIVDLLLRLLHPKSGAIEIDGVNIDMVDLAGWRKHVVYVAQDLFLRNDTVRANITFYDDRVTEEEMIRAAKDAHIFDVIRKLPSGFDTVIGERGTSLSGGERQRIALARALARKPHILVLDEATSAIDTHSEELIKETLRKLKGEVTVIAIAHRLSTLLEADRIVAVEKGRIIEEGSPEALLRDPASYFARTTKVASAA